MRIIKCAFVFIVLIVLYIVYVNIYRIHDFVLKPTVRIGFSFYTLIFTDFPTTSLGNLMIMFVFIKKLVSNVLEYFLQKSLKLIVIGSNITNDYFL